MIYVISLKHIDYKNVINNFMQHLRNSHEPESSGIYYANTRTSQLQKLQVAGRIPEAWLIESQSSPISKLYK